MDDGEGEGGVALLDGEGVVKGAQGVFRCGVTRQTGKRQEGGHAGDGDEVSVTLRLEARQHGQRAGQRAHEIDIEGLLMLSQGDVLRPAGMHDRGVVDQDIDLAEMGPGLVQRLFPLLGLGNVERHGQSG